MMGEAEIGKPNQIHAWAYVLVQGILLVLIVFLNSKIGPQFHRFRGMGTGIEWLGIIGILVCAANLGRSLTALPLPKDSGKLSTSGLYRYVRHPMYSSVLLFSFGIAVGSGSLFKYILVLSLYALFHFKSVYEERYLNQRYSDYHQYSSRIPRFIPFIKPRRNQSLL